MGRWGSQRFFFLLPASFENNEKPPPQHVLSDVMAVFDTGFQFYFPIAENGGTGDLKHTNRTKSWSCYGILGPTRIDFRFFSILARARGPSPSKRRKVHNGRELREVALRELCKCRMGRGLPGYRFLNSLGMFGCVEVS